YAELLGYAFLSRRSRSQIAGLIMLVVNAAFVLLPQDPITRVSCWIVLSIFMLWLVYRIAPASWSRVLRTQSSNSNLRGGRWLSHHPLLKKELQFLISLARLFPFVVCLVSIELFGYFFMDDSPGTILPISTALLIWITNDIWTLSSIGLEEKGITLYKITVYAWRKMLRTKWLLLWGLSSGIAVIHQMVWELILKHPFKDMIFPLLWNILLAAAMVSFCLWTGYKFAAPERSGYYRITFLGSWVIAFIMILLVCLRQMNMVLFTLAAVIIQVRFFFFYRQIPKE
ncbi:hypothetical protein, partial [Paenibacillus zanthoxyli]|uniref:hypothetical protein n=1 Tax=Paenibacillus zanthoxyli TaxID=369399 RepID=UPI00046F994A